jgi:hypothetical protein
VLSKDGIEDFTSKVIPFLHLTTKIPGKKDDDLLLKRGRGGFPTLEFMDADGNTITALHYTKRSLEGFHESLANAERLLKLTAAAKDDPKAARELLLLQMEMKTVRFAQAVERAKGLEFSPEQRLAYETALVETISRLGLEKAKEAVASLELQDAAMARAKVILNDLEIQKDLRPLMRGYRPGIDPEPPYEIALALYRKGRFPSNTTYAFSLFWSSVSRASFKEKDVKAFEASVEHLRPSLEKTNAGWLKRLEAQLETLKKESAAADAGSVDSPKK